MNYGIVKHTVVQFILTIESEELFIEKIYSIICILKSLFDLATIVIVHDLLNPCIID